MSRYLLDTNVVSEFRKPIVDQSVVRWKNSVPILSIYLSVLTFGEITKGIDKMEREAPEQALLLEAWRDQLYDDYSAMRRILDIDVHVANTWGNLFSIRKVSFPDSFIAATALEHNLTLVTRNEKHFGGLGIRVLNPFTPT